MIFVGNTQNSNIKAIYDFSGCSSAYNVGCVGYAFGCVAYVQECDDKAAELELRLSLEICPRLSENNIAAICVYDIF